VLWFWVGIIVGGLILTAVVGALLLHLQIMRNYLWAVLRIFQEKPLFIVPRGQPVADAEEIRFPSSDGLTLQGCYLRARGGRRGVILFGLEFGSNRWACVPYCDFLRQHGFDIVTFEPRNQGDSDKQADYDPLQWVTDHEVRDFQAALTYLKSRPDADPRGVGLFALSKGAGAGVLAAADDPYVRCFVTDGMFATHTTMVPYMRKWIAIYSRRYFLQRILPQWYYALVAHKALRLIRRERNCRFPHLEYVMKRLAPRPLLMIHGGDDNYIKPEMARDLFDLARAPKEFWLVEKAKHNQAFHIATEEYQSRVLAFFLQHLTSGAVPVPVPQPAGNGAVVQVGSALAT
jgi:pimeloyl-ACP methyl ester carboxylesterase